MAAASGVFYYASVRLAGGPGMSVAILLLGRALLGAADSFVVAAALSWGMALVGPRHTGTVMALVGTAIYFAYAVGAPAGSVLYEHFGFTAIAIGTTVLPLAALLLVAPLGAIPSQPHVGAAFGEVFEAIRLPRLGLALSCIGFGAITTFIPLFIASRGWGNAWIAFTTLSAAFVIGRLAFGSLPDRIGGAKVALVCVVVQAAGSGKAGLSSVFLFSALVALFAAPIAMRLLSASAPSRRVLEHAA